MSDTWLNDELIDSYSFQGSSILAATINVGDKIPSDTDIEIIDFLFASELLDDSELFCINYIDVSNITQVIPVCKLVLPIYLTSMYYAPPTTLLIPAGSILTIDWANTGNKTYSGLIRFSYRAEIEDVS